MIKSKVLNGEINSLMDFPILDSGVWDISNNPLIYCDLAPKNSSETTNFPNRLLCWSPLFAGLPLLWSAQL